MREAIETKTKSIWQEPAWYVSIAGSALDIAGSAAKIDGKRVREGNPLFTRSDGKVAWERAIPFTAASMYMQYKLYQNPKHRKWAIVSMVRHGHNARRVRRRSRIRPPVAVRSPRRGINAVPDRSSKMRL